MENNNIMRAFYFEGKKVRTIIRDGRVWFVIKDICDALGIQNLSDLVDESDVAKAAKCNIGNFPIGSNLIDFNSIKINNGERNGK